MDIVKEKWGKKNLISKAWGRCRSLGAVCSKSASPKSTFRKLRRSFTARTSSKKRCQQVAPEGCFSVYVGQEKKRFVVRAEFANHPLFKLLLEDAEMEYGFHSEGPILLPCDVDLFYKVLAEMESDDDDDISSFSNGYGSLMILCSPISRPKNCNGDYKLLSPSPLFKINQF
ncbi:hypothetical protein UlMin_007627 [Ulmus minor]